MRAETGAPDRSAGPPPGRLRPEEAPRAGEAPAGPDARPVFSPPMPPPAPDAVGGLGVLGRLRRNALGAFPMRCLDEPVVRLWLPGRALFLVTDGPAIAEMLQARAADYVRMPAARRILGPVVGRGLLTSEGAQWRRQRRAMAPAFTPRMLPTMAAHVMRAAEPACARLESAGSAPVDLYAAMQGLSLEIGAASMFSVETGGFRDRLRGMITGYMTTIGRPAPQDFVLPDWVPTPLMLRRRAFGRRWRRLMGSVVAGRRASGGAGDARDLFDALSAAYGADEDGLLVDEVATMIMAGHETTALTLFWALYLLARAPSWQAAVRAEARGLDLSPARAGEAPPRLPRTRAVVDETLRLYSPAFMTARLALRETRIGGHAVPGGSIVLVPFWLLHRDPALWDRPAAFDPGRFLGGAPVARGAFLPFGIGPHVCIGAQLAVTEAVLVLARIAAQFEVSLVDPDRPVMPVAILSTRPDHAPGFRLRPAP